MATTTESTGFQPPTIDFLNLFGGIYEFVTGGDGDDFADSFASLWEVFSIIAILLSALFIAGFVYAKIRYSQLEAIEDQQIAEDEAAWAHAYGGKITENNKWADIQKHIAAENPNDWRLAIIEADIMLDEVLTKHGFVGPTIGEKLKSANPNTFRTLQDAWSAHKVRNQIAHAGSDFVLTKKMANDTIIQFERIFREFQVI